MKHVASQSGIPVQAMQTFAPLLSQRSALPGHFAEIPMQGGQWFSPEEVANVVEWLLLFNYHWSIWEEARHKFN